MNEAYENIVKRTSVSSFTQQEVETEKIELLLKAAMTAPSSMNMQPWEFVVVSKRSILNKLGEALPFAKMLFEAPLAIIVCGNKERFLSGFESEFWIQDCTCAAENILLAANSLNLGAVYTGVYPDEIRMQSIRDLVKIPQKGIPLTLIAIGYSKIKHMPFSKWKTEQIHYDFWD